MAFDGHPPSAWAELPFFSELWPGISAALDTETRPVLPPRSQIFAALDMTPPENVRAVILGQDPYPTPGHAHGLAFSVEPDVTPLPRSLTNIFKEMQDDVETAPRTGDLRHWARQGVLMLNTALTVPAGSAGGHAKLGWFDLAKQVLHHVSERPTAFVLWGRHAQAQSRHIRPGDHLVIETAHPSPLSARRGFFGSRPFSKINTWLADRGETPIRWAEEDT
ncbi:uracil-DNA glycosylase [Aliiroseovarius sp. YM-037]|uniref:uracil-DNA glycosylase n=1 Tax=Aliiroseovarius sp. YM-037 TaxID=3341728 RepID=UPI003A7F762B